MGTTAEKLNKLKETKAAIKTAIENKDVAVPSDATFASYATYIGQISHSGITPSGTLYLTASTSTITDNVTDYASVSVEPTPSESKTVTDNGTVSPSSGKLLSSVVVNVPYKIYRTGSGTPSSDLGDDGDVYFDIS